MVGANLWIFLGVISLFHIAGNILLTRQLAECIPVVKERLPLLIILWFIPVAGAFYTFRKIGTDFYEPAQPGNTGVTADVMGMGEFLIQMPGLNKSLKKNYLLLLLPVRIMMK